MVKVLSFLHGQSVVGGDFVRGFVLCLVMCEELCNFVR